MLSSELISLLYNVIIQIISINTIKVIFKNYSVCTDWVWKEVCFNWMLYGQFKDFIIRYDMSWLSLIYLLFSKVDCFNCVCSRINKKKINKFNSKLIEYFLDLLACLKQGFQTLTRTLARTDCNQSFVMFFLQLSMNKQIILIMKKTAFYFDNRSYYLECLYFHNIFL